MCGTPPQRNISAPAVVAVRFAHSFSCQLHIVVGRPLLELQSARHQRAVAEQLRELLQPCPTLHRPYFASFWTCMFWGRSMVVGLECPFKVNRAGEISGNKKGPLGTKRSGPKKRSGPEPRAYTSVPRGHRVVKGLPGHFPIPVLAGRTQHWCAVRLSGR